MSLGTGPTLRVVVSRSGGCNNPTPSTPFKAYSDVRSACYTLSLVLKRTCCTDPASASAPFGGPPTFWDVARGSPVAAPSGPKSEDPGPNFLFATPRPFLLCFVTSQRPLTQ